MTSKATAFFRLTERQILVLLLIVALFVRVTTVLALDIQPVSDYAGYRRMALNVLAGNGLFDDDNNRAFMSAGYPLFVLLPVFSVFGNSLLAAQLANVALGILSIILVYLIAREAGAGRVGRLVAVAIFSFYVPSWLYAEYLAKENLMTPLMLGVIFLSLRILHTPVISNAIILGGVLGLLAITGTAGLAIVPIVIFAFILSSLSFHQSATYLIFMSLAAILILTPWVIRNYYVFGSPVLNTNGGFNLYIGNNPSANGYFVSIADTPKGETWQQLRAQGELEASNTLKIEAIDWIKHNKTQFATLLIKKAGLFWLPPTHVGQGPALKGEALVRFTWLIQYLLVCSLALSSLYFKELRSKETRLIWLAILSYMAVHMIFYVIFRYREPSMPLLIILAGMTVQSSLTRFRLKKLTKKKAAE